VEVVSLVESLGGNQKKTDLVLVMLIYILFLA